MQHRIGNMTLLADELNVVASNNAVELFLVKSTHWQYEREWRMLHSLADATEVIPGAPYPIHLFQFPPEVITSVILGARCSAPDEERIRGCLRAAELSHVMLKRAVPDDRHFMLTFRDEAI